MRFINSAITTIIFKALAMFSGLAASIVIARVLGPEGRGVYALIMTIIVLAASFGVFGLTASNTYFVAHDKSMARTIGFQSLIVGLLGTALSIATIFVVKLFSPGTFQGLSSEILWLSIALIPLFLWGNLFAFAYLGRGRIVAFNSFETGQRVIFFGLSVLLLWFFGRHFESYLTMVLVCTALLVCSYIINYFRNISAGPIYQSGYSSKSLSYGIKSYVATMLTLAVMRSGILFVNNFGGNQDAGYFAVAQQISELVIIIPTIVGTLLFGRVSKGDSSNLTPMVMRTIAAIFLPISVVMFLGGDWLIVTIFGNEFVNSILPFKILLPGAFLLGLEVIIANDIAGRGYPWPAVLAWIPVLVINVIGFAIFIPKFGVTGAAISMSVSFLVIFLIMTSYYLKLSKFRLSEILIIKGEDLKILMSRLTSLVSGKFSVSRKESKSADQAIPDKIKTEIQSVGR